MARGDIIAQQGTTRYMVETGTDDAGLTLGRVYDDLAGTLGPETPVASITGQSPGWMEPDLPVLPRVEETVAKLLG
jgi:hypothetical protein